MKNIVLLSDGTGNSAAKLFRTNVWRLYQALDLTDETRQIAYYDDGVGSSSFRPLALLGGAFGWGLKRNVVDLYAFLCRNYQEGDRIYCFGFSRGAFTIRILIGLINSQGLVKADTEQALRAQAESAFRRYRNVWKHWGRKVRKARRRLGMAVEAAPGSRQGAPEIAFAGLWDTVAAYGLPIDELTKLLSFFLPLSVPDRNPCPIMQRACHALAVDDERRTFHPVLWNEEKLQGKQSITQAWFAGAHSDVGGGYAEDGLAYLSLDWIMGEAHAAQLAFDAHAWSRVRAAMNVNGMLHDPRSGLGAFYRYLPRDIAALCNDTDDPDNQVVIRLPKIHDTVLRRIEHSDDGYAPIALPAKYAVLEAGVKVPYVQETEAQAEARAQAQKGLAALVGWRKFLYYCSALVVVCVAVAPFFPAWYPASTPQDWPVAKWVAQILGALLPDFLGFWIRYWAARLPELLALGGIFALLHYQSARLRTLIRDRMRAIWRRNSASPEPASGKALRAGA